MNHKFPATILGNGRSRLQFNLDQIHAKTVTYGCNAIWRDFATDYTIAIDGPIVFEIIDAKHYLKTKFYAQSQSRLDRKLNTQPELNEHIMIIPEHIKQNDSGNTAINLAIMNKHQKIYLVGFDYVTMPNEPNYYNNVYRSTPNYLPQSNVGVNKTNQKTWQNTLMSLIRKNPECEFIRVNGNDHSLIIPEKKHLNYREITPEQFNKEIEQL